MSAESAEKVSAESAEKVSPESGAEKVSAEKASAEKASAKVGAKKESAKKESPKKSSPKKSSSKKDLTDPGAFEAALALLARRVEHRGLQASAHLVALHVLRGRQRLAGLSPTLPGIARLRRSAALLAACSSMIGASIEGCPKRGQPPEGKNGPSPAV